MLKLYVLDAINTLSFLFLAEKKREKKKAQEKTIADLHPGRECWYFTPTVFKQQFQEDLDKLKGGCAAGWNMAPYDAAVMYWTSDPQKIRNVLTDPDWEGKVTKLKKGWIDQTKVDVQIGTQMN